MPKDINLTELFNAQLAENLKVADKIVDLRNLAQSERFTELAELANEALNLLVNSPLENNFFKHVALQVPCRYNPRFDRFCEFC